MRRELIEKVIELTLEQVRDKGWDLLDQREDEQIQTVADAIETSVNDFEEDIEFDEEWNEAIEELENERNTSEYDDPYDDDGALAHWNE